MPFTGRPTPFTDRPAAAPEPAAALVPVDGRATFADAVRSEWTKLRTLRSSLYSVVATIVVGVGMAFLFTSGTAEGYADMTAAERAEWDPTLTSLMGATLFAQLTVGALGVLSTSGEFATGMISTSLTAVPRRLRVLAAKALVITVVGLAVGELVSVGGFLLGQQVLVGMDVPHASLADHESLRAVVGAGLYLALVGLLGAALGVLIRSTAGAIVVLVVAAIIVPYLLGPLLPPLVRGLWPIMAGMMVMSTTTETGIPAFTLLGIMIAGVGATAAVACAVFRRRDI